MSLMALILKLSLLYLPPWSIALCDSTTLNCNSTPTLLPLFRKLSDVNDDFLSNLMILGNQMYTEVQQSIKSFNMSVVDLLKRNRVFFKILGRVNHL